MAKGFIYIAGAFRTVNDPLHGSGGWPIDNDPHFWTNPPTWGICRPDLRKSAGPGDVVFFVLPALAQHPQSVFAYLTIDRIVRHFAAYNDPALRWKQMRPGVPNGNIIVNGLGRYNRLDRGAHQKNFHKIQSRYAIGDPNGSRLLTHAEICALNSTFMSTLQTVLNPSRPPPDRKPTDRPHYEKGSQAQLPAGRRPAPVDQFGSTTARCSAGTNTAVSQGW